MMHVRNYYGISQDELATFLGVSRSAINMAEREARFLRPEPRLELVRMLNAMDHSVFSDKISNRECRNAENYTASQIESTLESLTLKISGLEKDFNEMRKELRIKRSARKSVLELRQGSNPEQLIILDVLESVNLAKINKLHGDITETELNLMLARTEKLFWEKKLMKKHKDENPGAR